MELDLKLTLALAGGSMMIETLDGPIELKIPVGTSHGELLRIKGKGVPHEQTGNIFGTGGRRGDLLVVTHISMPKKLSKAALQAIEDLKKEGI
jgi:DnaJ-class molecular chaperone